MLRQIKKENNKARILSAAIELFTKKGFEKTFIEDITRRAKVAKGTFYNFFKKKEDVLLYFLDKEIAKSRDEFQHNIASRKDFLEQFELLILIYLNHIFRNKEFAKVLVKERFSKMGTKDNPNEMNLIESLSQLIDLAKQRGEFNNHINTRHTAELLFAINTMYIVFWLNGTIKSRKECITKIKASVEILLNGVGLNRDLRKN